MGLIGPNCKMSDQNLEVKFWKGSARHIVLMYDKENFRGFKVYIGNITLYQINSLTFELVEGNT